MPSCFQRAFRTIFDPGWPLVLAGVLLLLAAGILPVQKALSVDAVQLAQLRAERDRLEGLRTAYVGFLENLQDGQESATRRLAAAHLGVIPAGTEAIARSGIPESPPTRWIEDAAMGQPVSDGLSAHAIAPSMLLTMASGTGRLWLFAVGLLAIFAGMVFGPAEKHLRKNDDDFSGAPISE